MCKFLGSCKFWGGLVNILGQCGPPRMDSPERLAVSSATATPTRFYGQRLWGFIFPVLEPGLCSLSWAGIPCSSVIPPSFYQHECGTNWSPSAASPACPLHPGCQSLPLLLVRMNVSSLTLWLSDFHTVRFSGSSGYSLFLGWLLSLSSLCEEAQCIYLCLQLGQKCQYFFMY